MSEYTGKDVSYYLVPIPRPKRLDPYTAECEDIIEALGMTFAEGCAFKAIWRKCAARTLGLTKTGYKGGLYDAEKAQYYGARMVVAETVPASYEQVIADGGKISIHLGVPPTEPASEIDDDSPRQQAIAQNGNDGAVYAELSANCAKAGHCSTCGIDQTQLHYVGCPNLTATPQFQAEVDATIGEVFGPGPWKEALPWAKYKAQDADGEWFFYSHEPQRGSGLWTRQQGVEDQCEFASAGDPNPLWADTLIERPAK